MNIYHIEMPEWLTPQFVERLALRGVVLAIAVRCDMIQSLI